MEHFRTSLLIILAVFVTYVSASYWSVEHVRQDIPLSQGQVASTD